ncbi:hypothetical protein ACFWPK_05950 [Nocardia sp. NPDC058519]|uniref:hypothetical protein n=1 Tax=unclassified Nocardia TaxID=2637762 RepID=UPI0036581763
MSKLVRGVMVAATAVALATGAPAAAFAAAGDSGSSTGSLDSRSLTCQIKTLLEYGTLSAGESAMWNIPECSPFWQG